MDRSSPKLKLPLAIDMFYHILQFDAKIPRTFWVMLPENQVHPNVKKVGELSQPEKSSPLESGES